MCSKTFLNQIPLGTDHLTSRGGGGGYGLFLKKYSDFGGGKKNNLIQSFCHIT
jgi:hypothetical protein